MLSWSWPPYTCLGAQCIARQVGIVAHRQRRRSCEYKESIEERYYQQQNAFQRSKGECKNEKPNNAELTGTVLALGRIHRPGSLASSPGTDIVRKGGPRSRSRTDPCGRPRRGGDLERAGEWGSGGNETVLSLGVVCAFDVTDEGVGARCFGGDVSTDAVVIFSKI